MLRHQHHSMQNQLREQNRMAGPMHPMQQHPHQPQHPHQHRSPHIPHPQQQLAMAAHQHPPHQIPHGIAPQNNPRQPVLLGINSQHTNGVMANVGLIDQSNTVAGTLPTQLTVQQGQHQTDQLSQQQLHNQQNAEQNNSPPNEDNGESRDQSPSNQNQINTNNTNLANMKEKTPMCLVNELARFNKIQHQYRLTNEEGPAHKKKFTVTLKLGDEEFVAEGPSIKKAQHSAATKALEDTWYRHPPPKPARAMRILHPGKCPAASEHLPPTVELNALAMKRGEPTVYTFSQAPPAPLQQFVPHGYGNFPRMLTPRYPTYNRGFQSQQQGLYVVTLKVGDREFLGRGVTGQAARHDAASRALEQLRQLPLPEEITNTCAANDNGTLNGIDDPNAELKSPVSLVHETALKRGLSVNFEVVSERGKPHIRIFVTKCTVGDRTTTGEGSSKKVSKKRAAELMLDELKRLPPIPLTIQTPSVQRLKRKPPATKKKSRNLIKVYQEPRTEPEAAEEVNPISRLIQIQQAKREREPVYTLVDEKGAPRRREFIMEVTVGSNSAQGVGPNKKLAKRAAAEALLMQLGYSKPQPQPVKPSIKTGDNENSEGKPRKVTFLEEDQVNEIPNHSVGGTTGRQLVPGLLLVDGGQESKLGGGPSVQAVAEELRGQQQHQTPVVSPKDQLRYLAQLLSFDIQFSDFPKGNHNEFLSLVSLSTDPPQVCHGAGPTTDASRDQAALTALRTLSKLGLDNVTNPQNKKDKGASGDGLHISNQVKNNMLNGAIIK
ncbi:double-stranded RNA-binding protein Staufen homolog 2 isoform X2 [Neodiprion lecontei]|uniref:Double-stranded RNA-binding protein Staufen homolog 2 isoform X2 n=1 Tax=Neodiprion lecontei TaxID=441921 RepID=A0A6J0C599_NEOLC|nr:double-stranded RNA-binding protein Staufen homolog 2 isoform X2 [Neodiprion lecontei]